MRQYKYHISKAKRDQDFYLHEIRFMPDFLPGNVRKYLMFLEESYRQGRINKSRIVAIATYLRHAFGIDYRIIDDDTIIFLPHSSTALIKYFKKYPNLMSIIGDRHSGKTITAWKIALSLLIELPAKTKLYVYGDVDNLGRTIIEDETYISLIDEIAKKKKNLLTYQSLKHRIIIKEDYTLPPLDGKPKIVLYNELSEALMGKRALSTENIELNLQALRSRHLNTWVIYNVVRHGTLEKTLRETANFFLFKWMTGKLLENAINMAPKGWGELIKIVTHFHQNEALAIVPQIGRGTTFFIHDTNPSRKILELHRKAKKNRILLMVKSEKERQIMERIAELKMDTEKQWTNEEIRMILKKEFGVDYSVRTIQNKWKKYRKITEMEK